MSGTGPIKINPKRLGGGALLSSALAGFSAMLGIRPSEHEHEPPKPAEFIRLARRGGHRARHRETRNQMAKRSRQINMRIRRGL